MWVLSTQILRQWALNNFFSISHRIILCKTVTKNKKNALIIEQAILPVTKGWMRFKKGYHFLINLPLGL